jgi:hypothetical protein
MRRRMLWSGKGAPQMSNERGITAEPMVDVVKLATKVVSALHGKDIASATTL